MRTLRGGFLLLAILIGGLRGFAWSAQVSAEELETRIAELVDSESWDEIALELEPWIRAGNSEVWAHSGLAQAFENTERPDEAAHHYELAIGIMTEAGEASGKEFRILRNSLQDVDPYANRRSGFFNKIKRYFRECVNRLLKDGHEGQALDLLQRIEWMLQNDDDKDLELRATLERLLVANEEVDLDASGDNEQKEEERPLVDYVSKHYHLQCNLEEEVTYALGDTMDDIFMSYVQIYLDGDESRIPSAKATIRVHGDWTQMAKQYPGQSPTPGLGGWWSPSENKVTNFDTRERSGSLDEMLGTLFHEASHQFMTALSQRGGYAPAWLNEGTASFFEGSKAMQDHRVLWPDVAASRLRTLTYFLSGGSGGPSVSDVIGYSSPGSYPGNYYCFGWGLVYYLQEFEDPETLAYVWRPYYQEYLQEITSKGGQSRELFDKIFLRKGNPGGFETFADFESAWKDWILKTVAPMHSGNQSRNLRLTRVDRYLAEAEKAKERRKAGVTEEDILMRALRDLEHVRTSIDRQDTPDGEVILQEAAVLGRLGRDGTEAHMIQLALDLSDDGIWDGLDDIKYAELTDRLGKINKSYRSLSLIRNRTRSLRKDGAKLLADYLEDGDFDLRSYTFAARAGETLRDPFLRKEANRLRKNVSEGGMLTGSISTLAGDNWKGIHTHSPKTFSHSEERITIEMEAGPNGRICMDLDLKGEYEIRCKLIREGEKLIGTFHGIVVAGTDEGDWLIVGINNKGDLSVLSCIQSGNGVTTSKVDIDYGLDELLDDDHNPMMRIHVHPEGSLVVQVDDQEVIEIELDSTMPRISHPGIFTKTGRTSLEDMVIENYP